MITVLILLVISPVIFFFLKKQRKGDDNLYPPGPPGLPFIGNLHQFVTSNNPHVYLWKLSKKYGSLISMKFGPAHVIVVSSAKLAEEALKTQDLAFSNRPTTLGSRKLSYHLVDMVFSPYNESWRELRKISAIHLLSLKKVQSFVPIREEQVSCMIKRVSNMASSCQGVNLSEMMISLTSNLMCRIAFSKRYDEETSLSERRKFDELVHEAQAMFVALFVSDYFPSLRWVDKLSGLIDRLEKNASELDLFYEELIQEHLDPNRPDTMKNDILDVLIKLKEENSSSIDLSWNHIKAMLMNIFLAGTDTGAAAAVWVMTALMKNPNAMKKVQEETREICGKKGRIEEEDLEKLPYLKAVVKETFRLHPPVPLIPRETTESCTLQGYMIRPKTIVYVNAWAIARDPMNWENPNDFLPERFLNSSVDMKGQNFKVLPFGTGRRICPGIAMGFTTVELAVANLVYSFDWEMPPNMKPQNIDTDVLPGITMHKKNALVLMPKAHI